MILFWGCLVAQGAAAAREGRAAVLRRKRLRRDTDESADGHNSEELTREAAAACAGAAVRALHDARPGSLVCLEAVRNVRRLLCAGALDVTPQALCRQPGCASCTQSTQIGIVPCIDAVNCRV